jgi:hypothetical protein
MYILKRVRDRTETFGTPSCIILVVEISPFTETLNFLVKKKANKLDKTGRKYQF